MKYVFDWDPVKEQRNRARHGVSFRQAMSVLSDAHTVTVHDASHSDQEDRWVTIGQTAHGLLLVLVHTFREIGPEKALVRIISARRATRHERRNYEERP